MADINSADQRALAAFMRLQAAWGKPLRVKSARRSKKHNAAVGGAKNSQHIKGNAFDIDVSHLPLEQRQMLAQLAWDVGFRGMGIYNNSLHFDIGPARVWGSDYTSKTAPQWGKDLVYQGQRGGPFEPVPGGHPMHGAENSGGGQQTNPQAPPYQAPLWEVLEENEEGVMGKPSPGMLRLPGTRLALNQEGLGNALMVLGSNLGGAELAGFNEGSQTAGSAGTPVATIQGGVGDVPTVNPTPAVAPVAPGMPPADPLAGRQWAGLTPVRQRAGPAQMGLGLGGYR